MGKLSNRQKMEAETNIHDGSGCEFHWFNQPLGLTLKHWRKQWPAGRLCHLAVALPTRWRGKEADKCGMSWQLSGCMPLRIAVVAAKHLSAARFLRLNRLKETQPPPLFPAFKWKRRITVGMLFCRQRVWRNVCQTDFPKFLANKKRINCQ